MGNLLANRTSAGFGTASGVAITSKDAGFDVSGLAAGWSIDVYHSTTDDIAAAQKIVAIPQESLKESIPLNIKDNGIQNFAWLPGSGYLWAYLKGGRSTVTVNMDVIFSA